MALIHSFEKSGNFLFKYRGQLPVLLFIVAIPTIYITETKNIVDSYILNNLLTFLAFGLSFLGLAIRAYTVGTSHKNTSGRNTSAGQVADVLNTTGIYSMVRNPLYLGNYFMWIGIVVYVFNFWFVLVVTLLFWLYYERIIFAEEQFLIQKFGNTYVDWSIKTPAFLPNRKNFKKSTIQFSWITVLRREYGGVSASILCFLFIDFCRELFSAGKIELEHFLFHYLPISIVALLFSFILRSLKHKTKLLNEDGRW
jgi:protein-S-isoprenylcysteine O-methyltransferase Ste14